MTRMQEQKNKLLKDAIKNIKTLRHLTGNSEDVQHAQSVLEGLSL